MVALGIGAGNTLEPLAGAYLLKRVIHFDSRMERVRDIFGLVLLAAVFSTMISASIGVTSLWLGSTIPTAAVGGTWSAWWVGDVLGAIVVAPLIMVWSQHLRSAWRPKHLFEASVYLLALAGLCLAIFHGEPALGIKPYIFIYATFPILIWVALRFGQVGSVTAIFVASAAIGGTFTGVHLTGALLSRRLLHLQIFVGITAVTFMTLAAAVAERERSQRERQRLVLRAESLASQRARLVALNQAKDEFIALASHQLRTPATAVKVYIGMLQENYAGKLSRAQKDLLETAYGHNERQLALINALLGVAKLDAGGIVLKKEKVDLELLINEIVDAHTGNVAARRQTIHFEQRGRALVANVDKEKIRMALENIIDNASKYSPSGEAINIRLRKSKDQIAIAVQDSGVGILKKDLHKLFKKFSRVDNPLSTAVDGTGLGLYLARKIVAMHQGSIKVTSRPAKGTTFTVTLPNRIP